MAFAHSASFKYRCFFALKTANSTEESLVADLRQQIDSVRMMRTLPVQSRLSQVADLVCTMKRIARRLSETGVLAKPESYFFGGEKNFRKNWIKSILRNEWK